MNYCMCNMSFEFVGFESSVHTFNIKYVELIKNSIGAQLIIITHIKTYVISATDLYRK